MKYFREAVFTTIFTLLVMGFIYQIPGNWIFQPIYNLISDFELADVFISKLKENHQHEKEITLVNIGYLDRSQIAQQIEIINHYSPKVIGIDASFNNKGDMESDFLLSSALSKVSNLVLVSELSINSQTGMADSMELSHPMFSQYGYSGFADVNSHNKNHHKFFRYCKPGFRKKDTLMLSFPTQIALLYDKKSAINYLNRANDQEVINFHGNVIVKKSGKAPYSKSSFRAIDWHQLLKGDFNGDAVFRNKIVIMGFLGGDFYDPGVIDKFYTPTNQNYIGKTNADMYGAVIHANIVSMIIKGNFINEMPLYISWLLSVLFIFLNIWLLTYCYYNINAYFTGVALLLVISQIMFIVIVEFYIYKYLQIKIKAPHLFFGLLISVAMIEFYQGIIVLLIRILRKRFGKMLETGNVSMANNGFKDL